MRPSSDSSANSDRMSGHLNDVILFLHAPDGSRWSNFMSTRLESPPYEIKSIAKDVTILEGPPDDDDDDDGGDHDGYGIEANMGSRESEERDESAGELYLNTSEILPYTSKTKKSDGNNNSANTAVTSGSNEEIPAMSAEEECEREIPTTIERKDRAGKTSSCESTSSAVILTANSSLEECILYSRACIVFLSPDILTSESPFPIEISVLNPRSTVFLLLGVEIQEVRRFFDSQSDLVFKCRCCHIDGSQVSICDALLQIVQAYEDTGGSSSVSGSDTQEFDPEDVGGGGIYNTPSSVQLNHVEKIFPRELTGGDRVVYALLEQSPEYKVFVKIASSNKEFEMTQVCDRLYSFSVPEGLNGKVSFVIGSQGHEIGRESVRVLSRLDQLHEILSEETDPKSMVAQAIGVVSGDEAGLDTALALRLQQLASAKTFATLFPVEEDLQKKKSRADQVMYPTLLHFAADYNLRMFCAELLKYPGMVEASLAENRDGETPLQVATRKRYHQLESDLEQFSRRHGISTDQAETNAPEEDVGEDNMYVQPSSSQMPPPPAHRTAQSSSPGYVNAGVESYITMNYLQAEKPHLFSVHHQMSHLELGGPKSGREFPGSSGFRNDDEDDGRPIGYQNLETFRNASGINVSSRSSSTRSSPHDCSSFESATSTDESPRTSASRKALKVMGITEEEIHRSKSAEKLKSPSGKTKTPDKSQASAFFFEKKASFESEESPQADETNPLYSKNYSSPSPSHNSNNCFSYSSNCSLNKFESTAQHTTPKHTKGGKMIKIKSIFSISKTKGKRSSSITDMEAFKFRSKMAEQGRRGSEGTVPLKRQDPQEERDSGSYSDEEKKKPKAPVPRRSGKNKAFKEREQAMVRRLSRRAQAAVNEKIEVAPTLPSRTGQRRGAFKSFVEDF